MIARMLMKTHSRLLYNLFRGKQTKRKIAKTREKTLMGLIKAHSLYQTQMYGLFVLGAIGEFSNGRETDL